MAGNARDTGRSVTSRALDIIGTFDTTMVRQSLSQISRRSGVPVSTCHRMVQDLLAWGALERHEDGLYTVGGRLARIGMLAPVQRGLRQVSAPIMQDVLFATRQVVNLQVRDGDQALVLDRLAGTGVGSPVTTPGDRLPLHTSAGGKVLLAHAPSEIVQQILEELRPATPETSVSPESLERMLEHVRDRGFATTEGALSPGTYGLAVPVFDPSRRAIAALGVVSMTPMGTTMRQIVPVLQVASSAISRALHSRAS
jgi:DNA-binding IclR family transcriptional regulator